MTTYMKRGAVAFGLAGALTLAASAPSFAAPVLSNTAALKAAAPSQTTDVAWRGRGLAAAGVGFAAGAVVGAAAASAAAPAYYYNDGYYGDPGYSYGYDAAYVEPGYGYGYGGPAYAYDDAYPAYGYRPTYNWGGGTAYTYSAPAPAYQPGYVATTRTYAAAPETFTTERRTVRIDRRANRSVSTNAYGSDQTRVRAQAPGGDQCWVVTGGDNNHGFMGDCKAKGAMPQSYRHY